ncbi:hypothetical protein C6P44_001365 [Monosporozyma unispora]|nr:hypothetical protein C6P44_001365 [Kazachstania unispora]
MIKEWLNNILTVRQIKTEQKDLTFKDDSNNETITLTELISKNVPEFTDGATDQLSSVLFNGHMQTCYTGVKSFENIDQVNYERYILTYPHGGEGALDFVTTDPIEPNTTKEVLYPSQKPFEAPLTGHYLYLDPDSEKLSSQDSRPMMIMCHGLTGGSHESYLRSIIKTIIDENSDKNDLETDFAVCVLNSRGCCQSRLTTPQLYNGGWTNDLRYCVQYLHKHFPNRSLYMMGFSLGAAIVTNYIGEENTNSLIKCAMVMGTPWDLLASANFIDSTRVGSKLYSPTLKQNLCNLVLLHKEFLEKDPVWKEMIENDMSGLSSVKEFDDIFTGPMFGYKDATDYYNNASPKNRIAGIRTPFVSINALDDPIVGGTCIPDELIKTNPFTMVLETNIGGHLGWFKDIYGQRWYPKPVAKFFHSFHNAIVAKGFKPINTLPEHKCPNVRTTFEVKIE